MSKILANEIANYGDNAPIDLKEGLNIPAGKPIQAAGSTGTSGQILSTTGASIQWVTPFSGSYTDLTNKPTIPAAQVNSDWNSSSGSSAILNKPVVPPLSSVTTASAGSPSLVFNSANGEFTYTPPDLSSYLTSYTETDPVYSASAASNVTTTKITNWDTAFGWGNHASVGYLTSETSHSDVVVDSDFATTGLMKRGASPGQYSIITDASNNWNTAFGWGNHGTQGYLTTVALNDVSDVDLSVAPSDGQVLKWEAASSKWKAATDLTGGGGGGLALTDLSVSSSAAAGGGTLTYNNNTGVFSYTPPDLSSYITSIGDAIQDADFTTSGLMKRTGAGTYTSTTDNSSNWDTAFGWGNHASQGYLTSLPAHGIGNHSDVTVTSPQNNQLLKYNTSLAQWENWTADYLTAESDTLQSVITRGGTVTSGSPSFGTNVFFTGSGTSAGNGGAAYVLWDKTNNDLLFSDDTKITLGYNGDLNIYHFTAGSGTNYISAANNTEIVVSSDVVNLMNQNHSGWYFKGEAAGSIVYHNNTARLTTTSSGVTLSGALTAGGLTYPTSNGNSGQILTSDGAGNVAWQDGSSGNTQVSISDTIPAGTASAGDLWWESDSGRLKIYYQDVDTTQWVDCNPPLTQDRIASSSAPSSATDSGTPGDIRYDSSYVYICISLNTWKRSALTTW